jgi:hypothetical protein
MVSIQKTFNAAVFGLSACICVYSPGQIISNNVPTDQQVEEFGPHEGFSGAGTAFQFESTPLDSMKCIFGYGSEDDPADIKIGGKIYTLKCSKARVLRPGHGKYHLSREEEWRWSNRLVTAIFKFRHVAFAKDDIGYRGTLTVTFNGRTSVYKIKGGSGD